MAGPWILGLAASHNGAACLLEGTRIVVAIQEERLTRVKRAPLVPSLPFKALDYVLETAGITVEDLDMVVLAPLHSPNAAHHDLDRHPRLASVPRAIISHHYAHAMGAYAQSGFDESAICVIDAMGSMSVDLPEDERRVVLGPWLDLEQDADPGCEPRELVSFYEASEGALTPLEKHLGAHQLYDPQGDMRPRMMGFVGLGVMYMAVCSIGYRESAVLGLTDGATSTPQIHPYPLLRRISRKRIGNSDKRTSRRLGMLSAIRSK